MGYLIRGGELIHADRRERADLLLCGERIETVAPNIDPAGHRVIDAEDCLVFAGFIDPHTHFDMECGAETTADDFISGSRAAVLGGTTSVIDFAEPYRGDTLQDAFANWLNKARRSSCNYACHMTLPRWDSAVASEMAVLAGSGVPSFKAYTIYDMMLSDEALCFAMETTARLGALLCIHCENDGMIRFATERLHRKGHSGLSYFARSRPPESEAEAVSRVLRMARLTGARVYLVHLSTAESLEEVRRARKAGARVSAETCPQYLLLTEERYEGEHPEAFVMNPPLRTQRDCDALWDGLADGTIQTVGTDHCSFTTQQKLALGGTIGAVPGGCAGVAQRAQLLYTYGVRANRIPLERMASLLSEEPARLFGLRDRGRLSPGLAADVVVWDPNYRNIITNGNHLHACDRSPYAGFAVFGRPRAVVLNGRLVAECGELLLPGTGRFLPGQAERPSL
jgi:dihydropyrimidinase